MKKQLITGIIFLAIGIASFAADPVAMVNGEIITKKQIDREVSALIPAASYHAGVSDSKKNELSQEALDKLINKILLVQFAREEGVTVSAGEVKELENNVVKSAGGAKKFEKILAANSLSLSEFRHELEKDIAVRKLYEKKVKTELSDAELKEYYEKNKFKFKEPEKVKIRMIYTRNNPELKDGGKIARKRADEAMAKIKKGEDFGAVASVYSNDLTRIKDGDMGFIHRGRIDNATADKVAFSLKKGEISNIVETDVGCYIFKVEDKRDSNLLAFDTVKVKLRAEIIENRENDKMKEILDGLKKRAKIKKY